MTLLPQIQLLQVDFRRGNVVHHAFGDEAQVKAERFGLE